MMLRNRHAHDRARLSITGSIPHRTLGAILAVTLALSLITNTAVAEVTAVEFDIPAQSVSSALRAYAQQAKVQLLVLTDGLNAVQANAVVGRLDPQRALEVLLAGTGLYAQYRSDATVSIGRESETSAEPIGSVNTDKYSYLIAQTAGNDEGDEWTKGGTSQTQETRVPGNSAERRKPGTPIEEIIVTGSNISGVDAVGVALITLDREYIELSGIPTTTELIQSVPQNFGLGNEAVETVGVIDGAGVNWGYSSSVNLRGLGSDSTLVLLNGRRSASGGSAGNFVDLNTIPTAAIDHIDILPDGASAIYGSDAVGGVINVILRNDYEGAETSIRYAPGTSDIDEIQFNQMFGKKWDAGNVLFSYEYYDRSELKSADRAYTRDSDLTSLGGSNHSSNLSNPGNIISPFTFADAFAIPADQDGTALTPADLIDLDPVTGNPDAINLQNIQEGSYVLPEQTRHSVFVSARQELSDTMELFAEVRYSAREFELLANNLASAASFLAVPESNAFFVDPFAGASAGVCQAFFGLPGNCVLLNYNFIGDYGPPRSSGDVDALAGVLGARFSLSNSWELEVSGSYGSEDTVNRFDGLGNVALLATALEDSDPATAFNPFADGSNTNPATLTAAAGFFQGDTESELTTFNIRAEGDLFEIPGGAAKLAIGAQYREQSLFSSQTEFTFTTEPVQSPVGIDSDRAITAAFAEIYFPLVTEKNSRSGVRELIFSIAGRYEDYSDFGDTFDPKLGVAWSPVESVKLRGTVGTSFRAPLLLELNTARNFILLLDLPDLSSPTGSTPTLVLLGNSPDLTPQEGTTWTAGFDLTPESLPGFSVGLTYFDTSVDDVIQQPTVNESAILNDEGLAPIVTRCPCHIADVTALMNDPRFASTPIPPDQVGAVADLLVQNIAKAELTGLDLNLGYAIETAAGAFTLSFYASHLFDFKEQVANGPLVDRLDTITKPASLKLRSSLSWNRGGMNAALIANHIGGYLDDLGSAECAAMPCKVNSWTTWDLRLGYNFNDQSVGFLEGTRLSFSVQNIFERDPPFANLGGSRAVGFDAINANPLGRFAAIQLTKVW